MSEVPLKCACGAVRGEATARGPKDGVRLVCYCDDCQAFAHHLGVESSLLDAHGGTDIYQLAPSQMRITAGADQLRCLRLSEKGLLRWFTSCCNTPVGNGLPKAWAAFIAVPHLFMDHDGDGRSRTEALGPVQARIQGRYALGEAPADVHRTAPPLFTLRAASGVLLNSLRGRQRPSPFFKNSGECMVAPRVLTDAERRKARTV